MVTDMHKLERAARLSLGDFETAAQAAPRPRRRYFSSRVAAPLAALAVLAIAAIFLT